jgi:hypothetical protein
MRLWLREDATGSARCPHWICGSLAHQRGVPRHAELWTFWEATWGGGHWVGGRGPRELDGKSGPLRSREVRVSHRVSLKTPMPMVSKVCWTQSLPTPAPVLRMPPCSVPPTVAKINQAWGWGWEVGGGVLFSYKNLAKKIPELYPSKGGHSHQDWSGRNRRVAMFSLGFLPIHLIKEYVVWEIQDWPCSSVPAGALGSYRSGLMFCLCYSPAQSP